MTPQQIINLLKRNGATTTTSLLDALRDGELLASLGVSDSDCEAVELAYAETLQEAEDLAADFKRASRLNDRLTKQGFFPTYPKKGE